jgi:uncharacterized membrane protein YdjX (TVP38/TMEM64 family)
MKTRRLSLRLLLLVIVLSVVIWYREPLTDLVRIVSDQEAVSAYLQNYGSLGPIILFVLMVSQVFIAVIPGHALMVTAGYVYGALGLAVVIASTILGSQLAFFIARSYGRNLIDKLASPEIIERWDRAAHYQGILFYFFAFVLPIFPSDLMCYVAGLGTISARRFFIANTLGRTCCAVFITMIGIYGMHPPVQFWMVAILGISAFFAGWAIYKKVGRCAAQNN